MYKGFALAVLLIAPILVMLADSVTPKQAGVAAAPVTQTAPAEAQAANQAQAENEAPPLAEPVPPQFQDMTQTAGEPVADAGKPMLDLSQPDEDSPPASNPALAPAPAPAAPAADPAIQHSQSALTAQWKNDRR